MKKQKRRVSKLGPCVSRMRHRFYRKNDDDIPVGAYVEISFNYLRKRCINCGGSFFFHAPFDEDFVRNTTPSPTQIHAEQARIAKLTK